MNDAKNHLTECLHCKSKDIEEVGYDIYPDDGDVVYELQYLCKDCDHISYALNSLQKGEFRLKFNNISQTREESLEE